MPDDPWRRRAAEIGAEVRPAEISTALRLPPMKCQAWPSCQTQNKIKTNNFQAVCNSAVRKVRQYPAGAMCTSISNIHKHRVDGVWGPIHKRLLNPHSDIASGQASFKTKAGHKPKSDSLDSITTNRRWSTEMLESAAHPSPIVRAKRSSSDKKRRKPLILVCYNLMKIVPASTKHPSSRVAACARPCVERETK